MCQYFSPVKIDRVYYGDLEKLRKYWVFIKEKVAKINAEIEKEKKEKEKKT